MAGYYLFVKNPNQWLRLALVRMLRYVAEKGDVKIAWTTGRQHAERWGELTKFDFIEYQKKFDPTSSDESQKYKVKLIWKDTESEPRSFLTDFERL